MGGLTWAGSQERARAGSKEGAHCLLVPADGVPSSCVTAFRHCVSRPGSPLSAHSTKSLLWVEGKATHFPVVHPIWAPAAGTYPQGLSRDKSHETHCQSSATPLLGNSPPQRAHGPVCQWTLASWWPACGACLEHLLECTRAGPNCIRSLGPCSTCSSRGSSSHICGTVGAAGRREHHGPCRSTCGIQESSGTVGF